MNTEEIIKETAGNIIGKIGFEADVEILKGKDPENFICNINVKSDSHLLIGQHGVNLQALQHIIRLAVRKKTEEKINFIVDVNSYRQQKNSSVAEMAKEAAQQAINERRTIVLRPMSAYERRLVHLELAENKDVATESIGEGEDRKVVIKPTGI
jgi:spoIIIJ-associated protein